jgi:glycerol-3-phosphate dehydrogenase
MRIAVIGAGVVGSLIARELTRYAADVLLFEQEADIGWGITKANSAIVHGGFHETPGTDRARFCVEGNRPYATLCKELDVPLKRVGAYTIAISQEDVTVLERLRAQGVENGVPGLEIHDAPTVLAREPNLNPKLRAGLWSPSVGITEPWALAIAAVDNAQVNGLSLHLSEAVTAIRTKERRIRGVVTHKQEYPVDAIVNAAGLFADRIAGMVGLAEPILFPRRGEYVLIDKKVGALVNSVIFPTPNDSSKGILVLPTVDGGILLGPTAEDLDRDQKESRETTTAGVEAAIAGARSLLPGIGLSLVTKTFAGLRPETADENFVVGKSPVKGFFQAAAMRSPGLTAAPAVADYLVHDLMARELNLGRQQSFQPIRKGIRKTLELSDKEGAPLIEEDPRYGHIVCQCNRVTEGEIVDAIKRGAHTVDGVKFRTRAGFGRCQGGFCTDKVLLILARELGVSPDEITMHGKDSRLLAGEVRP